MAQAIPESPRLSDVTYQHADFDPQAALSLEDPEAAALAAQSPDLQRGSDDSSGVPSDADDVISQVRRSGPKVGRNDPCPCGSGKKFKACHGKID